MERVFDTIRSLEMESKESSSVKPDSDEFKESPGDEQQEVTSYGIDLIRKNSEGEMAHLDVAGTDVSIQISSQQVFASTTGFTFVWKIQKDADQETTEGQDSHIVREHQTAFQLLTCCSSELLQPSMVIEGYRPRVNDQILCLQTPTGVTVRALDALDHKMASM